MSIKVLRDKRAALVKEADGLFAAATKENRALDAAEAARDDEISAELADVDAQIERTQRHMDRQRASGASADANAAQDRASGIGHNGGPAFSSLGEQMLAVARIGNPNFRGEPDNRLFNAAGTGLNEGVDSDGGFLVQTDFQAELLQNMWDSGDILSRVRRIPLGPNSNGIAFNGVDETSRANGSRWGGIQSYWTAEGQAKTASQPKFRRIKMDLFKLTGLCYATDELLQDSTALESWISQAFQDEMIFKVEDAIVAGTGTGMPLGFLNSGATITVSKEASQPAATIFAENILKMWARMPAKMRKSAVWLVNQDIEPQLLQMNIKVKNVAGTENVGGIALPQVIYSPPGTNGAIFGNLMGRPVIPVEYCSTLGTAGDIVLADLSQYVAIDKNGVQAASSIHVRFLFDETAFRFVYRFNGQPVWSVPMTPYKGTATQSPFIVLQTR